MKINNLSKAIPIRLSRTQTKALENLAEVGFNRSKLIRLAVDSYLLEHYKSLVKTHIKLISNKNALFKTIRKNI